jgi:serine/threonine protein kinase
MTRQDTTRIFSVNVLGPGTQLNGLYEIDEKLSSGGMGEVFRGHEIMSGHPVAIKVVLPELAKDETIVGLFNKEARILRDLNHAAIVRYMAFGTDPAVGRPYLVMEFIDGPSLVDVLEKGPLPLEDAKYLVARLAAGLDAAHQLGVIHRDISCDNVILASGQVRNAKIIDFGIARSSKSVTLLDGKFAGKYNFVSPEQLGLFNSAISEATDVYSLGLVMVNVLRGTPIDMNGTQVEIIEKRRSVPDISDIDATVRPVIELMLQPDPKDRNVTMNDIVDWFMPETTRNRSVKPVPTTPPRQKLDEALRADNAAGEGAARPDSALAATVLAPAPDLADGSAKPQARARKEAADGSIATGDQRQAGGKAKVSEEAVFASQAGGEETPARPDPLPLTAPKTPIPDTAAAGGLAGDSPVVPARPSKSKLPQAMAAVLALAVAGGGGWYFMNRPPATGTSSTVTAPALQPNQNAQGTGGETSDPATATAATGDGSTGTAAKPSGQTASLQQPAAGATDIKPADIGTITEWVADYDGGDCFFAHLLNNDPKAVEIEAVAIEPKLIDGFKAAYKTEFGADPKIVQKSIVERQCAVAQFLTNMVKESASPMTLALNNSKLKSGDPLSGQIEGLSKPNSLLYLIDNDGFVYQIDQFLKRSGDKGNFRIKLVELESRKPLPQIVMVLSSDKPVRGGALSQPAESNNLMPKLIEAIKRDKPKLDYGFAFFELGGT